MSTDLPVRARTFVAIVIATGALILAESVRSLTGGAAASVLVFTALAVVTGTCMMKLPRIETRFSLSDALVFTAVLLLGPACAAVAAAVDALAASLRFNKRDDLFASRTLFNVTAAAISVWVPGQAYVAVAGPAAVSGVLDLRALAVPLFVLVAGYSLFNTGAVATVVALTSRTRLVSVWRENFAWVWITHAWSGLAAGAIAIYVPHVNPFSLLLIVTVAVVGYATVRVYLREVEESTGHLHKLNDLYLATIRALAMAIDAKDQVTHGHIRRVQVYAVGLARALGVSDELTLKGIEAGALLHDTGKIAVPEHILNKPGKLTSAEYETMKTHVTIGAEILSGIDFPYPVIPFVRHHHENWDGTGYPDRLKGDDIPLGARILSVVDCFDALTSDRPYRRALSTEAAIDILLQRSGTMYDPTVVTRFIEIQPQLTAAFATEESAEAPASVEPPGLTVVQTPAPDDVADTSAAFDDLLRLASSGLRLEEVAFIVTNRLKRRVPFATAVVFGPRPSDDRLDAVYVAGPHADLFRRSVIRLADGLSGWVAANGQFLVNADPALDLRGPAADTTIDLRSALVVPFNAVGGSRGVLALYAHEPDSFTLDHARVVSAAAAHLARPFRVATSSGAVKGRIQAA